jgi:hypothetical protein
MLLILFAKFHAWTDTSERVPRVWGQRRWVDQLADF